jgi:hypothetical protein
VFEGDREEVRDVVVDDVVEGAVPSGFNRYFSGFNRYFSIRKLGLIDILVVVDDVVEAAVTYTPSSQYRAW